MKQNQMHKIFLSAITLAAQHRRRRSLSADNVSTCGIVLYHLI